MDKSREKKSYVSPTLTVVSFIAEHGYEGSRGLAGGFSLGRTWGTSNNDAWDGSQSDNSGSSFGSGWTDNGGDAWN